MLIDFVLDVAGVLLAESKTFIKLLVVLLLMFLGSSSFVEREHARWAQYMLVNILFPARWTCSDDIWEMQKGFSGYGLSSQYAGLTLEGGSALIHDFYAREVTNPLHLIVDTGCCNPESAIKAGKMG